MKSIEWVHRLTTERRGFWKVVGAIVLFLMMILFALEVISDRKIPLVPKPSVLEEDADSKTMPIEGIERPQSRPAPFGRTPSGPAPSGPAPFGRTPSGPAPIEPRPTRPPPTRPAPYITVPVR